MAIACGEPALAALPVLGERVEPLVGELDQDLTTVERMRAAADEARRLELRDRVGHRLRAHALGGRKRARRLRAFALEPRQDGAVRDREGVLGPQPSDELAEHDPELAGRTGNARRSGHRPEVYR